MTPATRKLALRAAAKVTLAGALIGCENNAPVQSPTTRVDPPDPTTSATSPVTDTTAALDAALPGAAPADITAATDAASPRPPVAAGKCSSKPTASNVKCCGDLVAASTDSATNKINQTPEARACCKVLIAYAESQPGSGGFQAHYGCCMALKNFSGACTPWGPPVPPEMDWVA